MNRATRMMLMNNATGKEPRRRRMGVEYEDWTPMSHYGPYMPSTVPSMPMEPQSSMNTYGEPESTRRYDRYSDGRLAPRGEYMQMEPWSGRDDRQVSSPRMIGFGRDWDGDKPRSDATMPQYIEMDHLHGRRIQQGGAYGADIRPFDRQMAMEWAQEMENADGTKGPHWNIEQVKQIMAQHEISGNPWEFFVALNATYSDLCKVFKKHGLTTVNAYVDFAKAFWMDDKDSVPDKLAAYYEYVVKH